MANGGQTVLGGSSSYSRWSMESPHQQQGPVYAVSKSARAESRRASSNDLGDPGYSSLANAPECLRPFPAELTVEEGEKAEVDCLMLGNPRPKVQWFFNGRPIKPGYQGDFVELTVSNIGDTYSIRFNPAQLHFSGWYRCVAENIRGRCESLTLIHVRPRSMIQRPGGYQYQKARRSIGGVQGLLQLQKQQQQMLQQQQTRALSTPPRPMNAATPSSTPFSSFTPTLQRDRGQQMPALMSMSAYQAREEPTALPAGGLLHFAPNAQQPLLVEAHSEHRILTDQLLAQYSAFDQQQTKGSPPHFMQTLVSAVVAEGQPVRFEAVVTGLPQPRMEWTKDGQPLSPSPNLRIWTEGGRALLAINEVGEQEAGKYCCKAENASGMASSSAQLVLRPKTMAPDFLGRLISEEVEEGAVLKWTVRTSGEPEPTVSWLRDGQPIAEVQGVALAKEGPFLYTLLIDQVQVSDAGQFTCVLENSAGEARSTADLVVRPRGSAPGKYVHVTKVTQEKQTRGEELARNETVTIEGQMASAPEVGQGEEEKEEEEEEE